MKLTGINKEIKNRIISLLEAFLVTFAIFDIGHFSSSDILLGLIFFAVFYAIDSSKKGELIRGLSSAGRRANGRLITVSVIWTCSYMIYASDRLTGGMENRLFILVYEVLAAVGIFIGIYLTLRLFAASLITRKADYVEEHEEVSFSPKKMLIFSGVLFIAMLPLFLLNYPATMTVDSFEQLNQVRNMMAYSDHHPWAHTMIIKVFYSLGYEVGGSVNSGIATYVLFQMLVTALSVGYSAATIDSMKKKRIWSRVIILGFILYPYHLAYSITIWKDILFADMVLLLTVTIYRRIMGIKNKNLPVSRRDCILAVISGIGMCLLRHNGLYAYIVTAIILILAAIKDFVAKKENAKKRLLSITVITLVTLTLAITVKGPVQKALNVTKGDSAHNYAIPLQQLARTIQRNGRISDADLDKLEKINSILYIQNNYIEGGADNMVQWLIAGDSEYFEAHKLEYLELWARVGIDNPLTYLEAFVEQTKGYYTTMMPEQIAYYGILPNEDGLENAPVFGAGVRIKINELCSKLQDMIPVYGIFYSMGACMLLLVLWMTLAAVRGERYLIMAALPVITLILTVIIATPLVADLRYAYPLMLGFPTLTAILLGTER